MVSSVCKARAGTMAALAPWSGKPFNTAAISRELEISRPTLVSYVKSLENEGLVRILPSCGKRRRPLLLVGLSSCSAWAESIIVSVSRMAPGSRFSWWSSRRTRVIELIADIGSERIGFRFLDSPMPRHRDWFPLEIAFKRGVIRRGFLLYTGTRAFVVAAVVQALPVKSFTNNIENWLIRTRTVKEAQELRERINSECLARGA